MNREMFVRVATVVLTQGGVLDADKHAEAIAKQMDLFAQVMGDAIPAAPPPVPAPPQGPVAPFPSPNPAAIAPVPEPEPEPEPADAGPPMVTLETAIPDKIERADPQARMAASVRSVRKPATKMKVEDLNQLIQDRTPLTLTFDVPMEEGGTKRVTYLRNVISRHNEECVQLVYYPPNCRPSAQEVAEVFAVLNVDDVPFDLPTIMKTLTDQAIKAIMPRPIPQSVTPPLARGPVQSGGVYSDGGSANAPAEALGQTQAVFGGLG